jgi:hypothetical protein
MKQLSYYQQIDVAEAIAQIIGVDLDEEEYDEKLDLVIDAVDWDELEALRKEENE